VHIRTVAYGLAIFTTKRVTLSSWDLRGRVRKMVLLELFRRTDALGRLRVLLFRGRRRLAGWVEHFYSV
jgi:hypothetical protein